MGARGVLGRKMIIMLRTTGWGIGWWVTMRRSMALVLAVCLVANSGLTEALAAVADGEQAAVAVPAVPAVEEPDLIPVSEGRITGGRNFGSKDVVIQIQDLHCHAAVQKQIAQIVDRLDRAYGLQQVYVEGAWGAVDTSWLTGIADRGAREELTQALVESGRMSGAEYYSVMANRPQVLRGLENEGLYRKNFARLQEVLKAQDYLGAVAKDMDTAIGALTAAYYTPRQAKFAAAQQKYHAGKIDARKYYTVLQRYGEGIGLDVYSYRNLMRYRALVAQNRRLQYRAIARDMRGMLVALKQRMPYTAYQALAEKTENFGHMERAVPEVAQAYTAYVANAGQRYPRLESYFAYLQESQAINPVRLVEEEAQLERAVAMRLAETESGRNVAFLADCVRLFKKYSSNQMSAREYAAFAGDIPEFTRLWDIYVDDDTMAELEPYRELLGEYYAANSARNREFIRNLFDGAVPAGRSGVLEGQGHDVASIVGALPKAKVRVMVTGGYHTDGVSELLAAAGVSYLVITPAVSAGTLASEEQYRRLAAEQGQYATQANALASLAQMPTAEQATAAAVAVAAARIAHAKAGATAEATEKEIMQKFEDLKKAKAITADIVLSLQEIDNVIEVKIAYGKHTKVPKVYYFNGNGKQIPRLQTKDDSQGPAAHRSLPIIRGSSYYKDKLFAAQRYGSIESKEAFQKYFTQGLQKVATEHSIEIDGKPKTVWCHNDLGLDKDALTALIHAARNDTGGSVLPARIVIALVEKSPYLFMDSQANGFVGINKAVLELKEKNPELFQVLLKVGIFHELCHEVTGLSGNSFEEAQRKRDIAFAKDLLEQAGISVETFTEDIAELEKYVDGRKFFEDIRDKMLPSAGTTEIVTDVRGATPTREIPADIQRDDRGDDPKVPILSRQSHDSLPDRRKPEQASPSNFWKRNPLYSKSQSKSGQQARLQEPRTPEKNQENTQLSSAATAHPAGKIGFPGWSPDQVKSVLLDHVDQEVDLLPEEAEKIATDCTAHIFQYTNTDVKKKNEVRESTIGGLRDEVQTLLHKYGRELPVDVVMLKGTFIKQSEGGAESINYATIEEVVDENGEKRVVIAVTLGWFFRPVFSPDYSNKRLREMGYTNDKLLARSLVSSYYGYPCHLPEDAALLSTLMRDEIVTASLAVYGVARFKTSIARYRIPFGFVYPLMEATAYLRAVPARAKKAGMTVPAYLMQESKADDTGEKLVNPAKKLLAVAGTTGAALEHMVRNAQEPGAPAVEFIYRLMDETEGKGYSAVTIDIDYLVGLLDVQEDLLSHREKHDRFVPRTGLPYVTESYKEHALRIKRLNDILAAIHNQSAALRSAAQNKGIIFTLHMPRAVYTQNNVTCVPAPGDDPMLYHQYMQLCKELGVAIITIPLNVPLMNTDVASYRELVRIAATVPGLKVAFENGFPDRLQPSGDFTIEVFMKALYDIAKGLSTEEITHMTVAFNPVHAVRAGVKPMELYNTIRDAETSFGIGMVNFAQIKGNVVNRKEALGNIPVYEVGEVSIFALFAALKRDYPDAVVLQQEEFGKKMIVPTNTVVWQWVKSQLLAGTDPREVYHLPEKLVSTVETIVFPEIAWGVSHAPDLLDRTGVYVSYNLSNVNFQEIQHFQKMSLQPVVITAGSNGEFLSSITIQIPQGDTLRVDVYISQHTTEDGSAVPVVQLDTTNPFIFGRGALAFIEQATLRNKGEFAERMQKQHIYLGKERNPITITVVGALSAFAIPELREDAYSVSRVCSSAAILYQADSGPFTAATTLRVYLNRPSSDVCVLSNGETDLNAVALLAADAVVGDLSQSYPILRHMGYQAAPTAVTSFDQFCDVVTKVHVPAVRNKILENSVRKPVKPIEAVDVAWILPTAREIERRMFACRPKIPREELIKRNTQGLLATPNGTLPDVLDYMQSVAADEILLRSSLAAPQNEYAVNPYCISPLHKVFLNLNKDADKLLVTSPVSDNIDYDDVQRKYTYMMSLLQRLEIQQPLLERFVQDNAYWLTPYIAAKISADTAQNDQQNVSNKEAKRLEKQKKQQYRQPQLKKKQQTSVSQGAMNNDVKVDLSEYKRYMQNRQIKALILEQYFGAHQLAEMIDAVHYNHRRVYCSVRITKDNRESALSLDQGLVSHWMRKGFDGIRIDIDADVAVSEEYVQALQELLNEVAPQTLKNRTHFIALEGAMTQSLKTILEKAGFQVVGSVCSGVNSTFGTAMDIDSLQDGQRAWMMPEVLEAFDVTDATSVAELYDRIITHCLSNDAEVIFMSPGSMQGDPKAYVGGLRQAAPGNTERIRAAATIEYVLRYVTHECLQNLPREAYELGSQYTYDQIPDELPGDQLFKAQLRYAKDKDAHAFFVSVVQAVASSDDWPGKLYMTRLYKRLLALPANDRDNASLLAESLDNFIISLRQLQAAKRYDREHSAAHLSPLPDNKRDWRAYTSLLSLYYMRGGTTDTLAAAEVLDKPSDDSAPGKIPFPPAFTAKISKQVRECIDTQNPITSSIKRTAWDNILLSILKIRAGNQYGTQDLRNMLRNELIALESLGYIPAFTADNAVRSVADDDHPGGSVQLVDPQLFALEKLLKIMDYITDRVPKDMLDTIENIVQPSIDALLIRKIESAA